MTLAWLLAAFVAGMVAKGVRLPSLVGYLAAGLFLSLFGVTTAETLVVVGDLGVVLLLFSVGLHLNLRSLLQIEVLGSGGLHLLISALLYGLIFIGLQFSPGVAVIIAISLGFSSTVLTAKTLDGRNELDSYHGRLAIGILILQDVVAVVLLVLAGGGAPTVWALGLLALPLLRPILLKLLYLAGRDELLILYGLLLALGVGWLFNMVGLDAKLGALAAGMLLAGDARSDELYDKLWGVKELFLVGFFLQVGLAGLPDVQGWLLIGLLLLLLPLKGVLFFFLMLLFKLRARTAFLSTLSLTAYSEFALIVAAGAAAANLIEAQFVTVLALLVAISYALNAPLSRLADSLWQRLEPSLLRFERAGRHPDHAPLSLGAADYLILGMGPAGAAAYDYLITQGKRPLGLDADPARIKQQLQAGRRIVLGDAKDAELWAKLDLAHVEGILLTLSDVKAKIIAANNLRQEKYDGFVAALLRYPEHAESLQQAGVTVSFLPLTQAGVELAQASLGQATAPSPKQPES
ncbi:MAG: cation:proton antiporter [Anaerolineales bacterium]|nr:cation:proton antiporter [Anaerolineales bacterium]